MAHNVSLQPDTKALLDAMQKEITAQRREKNLYPWKISQDAIIKMALEGVLHKPERVLQPVNARGTLYGGSK